MPVTEPGFFGTTVLVGLGGAAGAMLRYTFTLIAYALFPRLPLGTLLVNVIGCFIAGVLLALWWPRGGHHPLLYPLLVTGALGGFTTFSAFSLDTLRLVESGQALLALFNVLANTGGALLAVTLGWLLGRLAL